MAVPKLIDKIIEILSAESPLTLKEIVGRVMESNWQPPKPKDRQQAWAVSPYVVQALFHLTKSGTVARTPNREGVNQYFLEK